MLQIIRDEHYLTDKNANRFVVALQKEGFKQDINIKTITIHKQEEISDIDFTFPTIVIEPFGYTKPKSYNDVDKDTTAKVVFNIIKNNCEYDTYSSNILLIGRGETVNKPLLNMLVNNINANITIINSKTYKDDLQYYLENVDIIVCSTNSNVECDFYIVSDLLIDVGNTFDCNKCSINKTYKMKDIGKLTVQQIIKNAKEII